MLRVHMTGIPNSGRFISIKSGSRPLKTTYLRAKHHVLTCLINICDKVHRIPQCPVFRVKDILVAVDRYENLPS